MGHALGNNYGKFYSFQSKPVLLDLEFTVDATQVTGTSNVKGQGVSAVYMQSSGTPSAANPFVATTSAGYALIRLAYNYNRSYAISNVIRAPLTGGALAINGSALTAGIPYEIVTVGAGTKGAVTIAPVADSSGSLASTWFNLYDAYGNTFTIWFSVSGVGTAPTGTGGILVQQSISTNDSASTIGTALAITIAALPIAPGSAVFSFTAAATKDVTNLSDWQRVGVPKGVTPAVGVGFVATATGYSSRGGSTGTVKAFGTTGIDHIEVIGSANLSLAPIPMGGSPNVGGWILIQFMNSTTPTAPTAGSLVKMTILLEEATRVGGNNE